MTHHAQETGRSIWLTLRRSAVFLLALCVALSAQAGVVSAGSEPAATDDAQSVVQRLHDSLLEAMRLGDQTGFESRYNAIEPVVREDFDMTMISRLVLGRHWSSLSEENRRKFIDTFTRYVISNYAAEFDHYNDQRFEFRGAREQRAGVKIISSQFVTKSEKTHRFDYQLQRTRGHWRIVNIAIDGVSDLAMKRSQYTSVIKKDGFTALVDTLESRIRDFAEGRDEDS